MAKMPCSRFIMHREFLELKNRRRSKLRGLQTPVRAIRRQVFTEVAKLGFKANAETLVADMEAIPYEIVGEASEVK